MDLSLGKINILNVSVTGMNFLPRIKTIEADVWPHILCKKTDTCYINIEPHNSNCYYYYNNNKNTNNINVTINNNNHNCNIYY